MNDEEITSYILACKNLELAYETLREQYSEQNCKFFIKDSEKQSEDFLLEDAKSVVKEAYVAESEKKIIILGAKTYNIYAQNSLLKILEEPPKNIIFILVCESKNVFLPTIRSRLLLKELDFSEERVETELNLANLDLKDIYDFVQKNSRVKKNELKNLMQVIVSEAIIRYGISFRTKELEHFEKLLQLSELNSRPVNILISLLLTIYLKRD
ncbi:MAG: DNA polymerase III subunit delta' [Sulfurospirillum sp.]